MSFQTDTSFRSLSHNYCSSKVSCEHPFTMLLVLKIIAIVHRIIRMTILPLPLTIVVSPFSLTDRAIAINVDPTPCWGFQTLLFSAGLGIYFFSLGASITVGTFSRNNLLTLVPNQTPSPGEGRIMMITRRLWG